jgi:hypothetical protein
MKKILLTAIVFSFVAITKAQTIDQSKDTVFINKVTCRDSLFQMKTNKFLKSWSYHKRVKLGYILNKGDGWWLVNNKLMRYHQDNSTGEISFSN